MHPSQLEAVFTELERDEAVELGRVVGGEGLLHRLCRDYAVFHQIVG